MVVAITVLEGEIFDVVGSVVVVGSGKEGPFIL